MPRAVEAAIIGSVPATAAISVALGSLLPLAAGLCGVVLARTVFNDRVNRKRRRPQTMRETLPLTGVAALITTVVIVDRQLVLSTAAFLGLGVGYAALLLLESLGEWVLRLFPSARRQIDDMTKLEDTPPDMEDMLELIDQRDRATKKETGK